jgi:hypothetical protein
LPTPQEYPPVLVIPNNSQHVPPPPVPPPLPTGPPLLHYPKLISMFLQAIQDELKQFSHTISCIIITTTSPSVNTVNQNIQGNEEEKEKEEKEEEDLQLLYTEDLFIKHIDTNEVVDRALQDEIRTKIMHNLRNRDYHNSGAVECSKFL